MCVASLLYHGTETGRASFAGAWEPEVNIVEACSLGSIMLSLLVEFCVYISYLPT